MKTTQRRNNNVIRPNQVIHKFNIKVKEESVTDSTGKASTFNNHFSGVSQVLNVNILNLLDFTTQQPVSNE